MDGQTAVAAHAVAPVPAPASRMVRGSNSGRLTAASVIAEAAAAYVAGIRVAAYAAAERASRSGRRGRLDVPARYARDRAAAAGASEDSAGTVRASASRSRPAP